MKLLLAALPLLAAASNGGVRRGQQRDLKADIVKDLYIDPNWEREQSVPCANDGAGELIDCSGDLLVQIHRTENKNGLHFHAIFNPQGIKCVGQVTGDIYNAVGQTHRTINESFINDAGTGRESSFESEYKMVGPGPGNDYTVKQNFHLTINANGDVTAEVTQTRVECK